MRKLKPKYCKKNSAQRLHQLTIPVVGLTGGIGTGKTTVSDMLKAQNFPVICADSLVHDIYTWPETIKFLQSLSPDFVIDNKAVMTTIRQRFFQDKELKQSLEKFIYEKLPKSFEQHLSRFSNPSFVIYDVPLLFERKLESQFDLILCVYAPAKIQRQRIHARNPELSHEDIEHFLKNQIDIEYKKLNSDFVIDNTGDISQLTQAISNLVAEIFSAD